jgi:hypothetical protein
MTTCHLKVGVSQLTKIVYIRYTLDNGKTVQYTILIDTSCLLILLSLFAGETMVWKARNFGDRDLFQKAQNIRMPSCDALRELQAQGV